MSQRPTDTQLSRTGLWYVGVVSLAGLTVLGASINHFALGEVDIRWLGLAVLTIASASVTIKVPAVPARISVSETFVFTALIVFGTWAGALTVALDGLVASLWIRRKAKHESYRTLFNVAAPTFALWVAAEICFGLARIRPIVEHVAPLQELLAALFLLAALYFFLNSWLMALAISIERRTSAFAVWSSNFLWLAINYFGGASVSVLLVLLFNTAVVNTVAIGIIVPLLTFFYLTFRIAMARSEDTISHLTERNEAAEARAKLEAELREAHRLESVGIVAARIADDFNSLLTPIIGSAAALLKDARLGGVDHEELVNIKYAAERAQELTRQLKAFGRRNELAVSLVDLRALVLGFERLVRRTVRKDIHVDLRMADAIGPVRADAAQIEQALMNLAIAAEDAMPDGGALTIGLDQIVIDPAHASRYPDLHIGRYAVISVTDSGLGIDRSSIARMIEPGFAAQGNHQGVGLGLSTVYRIAKLHGGHLAVESAPGRGTRFALHLPQETS